MSLNVPVLRASFELVVAREPELAKRFYEHLFSRYPHVEELFGRNTSARQQKMLTEALVAVVDHLEDAPWLAQTLHQMGAKHVSYGVTDEMYGWVGECLLLTLSEIAGTAWSSEVEQAWIAAYTAIAELMQQGAAEVSSKAKAQRARPSQSAPA